MYVRMYVCMYVCVRVCNVCMYVCMYVCVRVCNACMYVCVYMYVHVYARVFVCRGGCLFTCIDDLVIILCTQLFFNLKFTPRVPWTL